MAAQRGVIIEDENKYSDKVVQAQGYRAIPFV